MKRLLAPFVVIFTSLVVLLTSYITWRVATDAAQAILIAVLACLLILLPTVHWRHKVQEDTAFSLKLLQQASYLSMALLSWLLVITVARDVLLLAVGLVLGADTALHWAAASAGYPVLGLTGLVTLTGLLRTFRGPQVRELTVPIVNLPDELVGLKIAQISDLHIGPTIGRKYVENLAQLVASLAPDLTVLTGDIVDGSLQHLREDASPLAKLLPSGRVYFVPGNHEYYWTLQEWLTELEALGAKILLNTGSSLTHNGRQVWVGGVTDPAAHATGLGAPPDVAQAAQGGEHADFRLLLSHRPGYAAQAAAAGFHLQLSGHTHGGQFFPWTHVAKLFHQYFLGLMQHERMWIYVSPGTGTWGPPQRIGTTPELSLIRLTKAPS